MAETTIRNLVGVLLLSSVAAWAQTGNPAQFEVASVKLTEPSREVPHLGPDSVSMRRVRLSACIQWAYDVRDFQISGPEWLREVGVDIQAKASAAVKDGDLRLMMRQLLADQFKLAVHRQPKELPALVLTVGNGGHKMQAVAAEGEEGFETGRGGVTATGATLARLTQALGELGYPVIDQTGLTGRFNYLLNVSEVRQEMIRAADTSGEMPPEGPAIVSMALQAQLGLKLDLKKVPVEMLVVDHIERTPTEN